MTGRRILAIDVGYAPAMPVWVAPLAAAVIAVVILNASWLVQRVRHQPDDWPTRFLKELRHWNGRVPDELER